MESREALALPQFHRSDSASFRRLAAVITRTEDDLLLTTLRILFGAIMLAHGCQKVFGWFGGFGYDGTMQYFTEVVGLPPALGTLTIALEFVAPIALLLGVGARVAALGIAAIMVGAIATVHLPHGLFMNWAGQQKGEGFEYHLLAIAIALVIAVGGSGRYSLDRLIARTTQGK